MRNVFLLGAVLGFGLANVDPANAAGVNARPYYKIRNGAVGAATPPPYTVAQLCSAYNFPTKLKGGGVIGIIELGGGWVQSDLDAFSAANGLPKINVTNVFVNGGTNSPGGPDDFEVALDIEVVAAAYYYATGTMPTIKVFFGPNNVEDPFSPVIQAAVQNGCDILSISWGAPESYWTVGAATGLDTNAQTAALSGLLIFAASGDNSSDDTTNSTTVDAPSSCPHIIACGGTKKTPALETVWGDGFATDNGTGGGYSAIFPVQSFQIGAPAPPKGLGRMVPDVSADADPNTGLLIYVQGNTWVVGGTSGVAPLYSGLFASFGTKLGFVSPKLWLNQKAFVDITQGSNGAYSAATGPDPCTGIGVPDGTALSKLFVSTGGAPFLSGSANLTYGIKKPALPINPNVLVTDVYAPTLATATVSIANVVPGEDSLSLNVNSATMGNITAVYTPLTGVLKLTSTGSTATLANFQAALRAVSYSNSNVQPNKTPRTINFQVSDGTYVSNTLKSTVTIGYFYVSAKYTSANNTLTLADDAGDNAVQISLRGNVLTVAGTGSTLIGSATNSQQYMNFAYNGDMLLVCNFTGGNDTLSLTSVKSSNTIITLGDGNDSATLTYCNIGSLSVDGGAGTNTLSLITTTTKSKTIKNIQIQH